MQLLGIEREADSTEINKAYRVKKYEHRFNSDMLQKVESAHSTIMLSQLSARRKV